MPENCFRVGDCSNRVGDCAYQSFSSCLCLHCFSGVSKQFVDYNVRKISNFALNIPEIILLFCNSKYYGSTIGAWLILNSLREDGDTRLRFFRN